MAGRRGGEAAHTHFTWPFQISLRFHRWQTVKRPWSVLRHDSKGDFRMPQAPAPEEMNVYQNAEARFEVAANKLGLEQGLYRYLKYPSKEITLYIPVGMD